MSSAHRLIERTYFTAANSAFAIDHRPQNTEARHVLKLRTARIVVWSVTTSESRVLIVFVLAESTPGRVASAFAHVQPRLAWQEKAWARLPFSGMLVICSMSHIASSLDVGTVCSSKRHTVQSPRDAYSAENAMMKAGRHDCCSWSTIPSQVPLNALVPGRALSS